MTAQSMSAQMARGLVAIVDDDPAIAEALSVWLEFLDIRCATHGSAESFLAHLLDQGGLPVMAAGANSPASVALQAVVLDINLPGMHGLALARQLRKRYAQLPIALVTARSKAEIASLGALPAGVTCLQKPFDLGTLHTLLLGSAH